MKKYLKLLSLALVPLLLSSCKEEKVISGDNNQNNTNENTNNGENNNNGNEGGKNQNNDTPKDIEVGQFYESVTWDATVDKMAKEAVGDLWNKIPKFIAPEYVSFKEYAQDGNDVFLIFNIYCYGPNVNSATLLYQEKLEENGFTIGSTKDYAYLMKDYESDLYVGYGVADTLDSFNIRAVVRQTRHLNWDSEFIDLYAGTSVPVCEAKAYNITYDNSRDQVYVYALFVGDTAMKDYEQTLKVHQYTYGSESTSESSIYYDPTGYVSVQIYETYGDYNSKALYITITNAWPTIGIASFNGIVDFPKLDTMTGEYGSYAYMDMGGVEDPKDYVLCIYYDNVSNVDFAGYVNKLVNNYNFVASDASSDEDYNSVYLTRDLGKYTVTIRVLLSVKRGSICIVFYQSDIPTETTGE